MGAEQSGIEGGAPVSNQCFHCLGTGTKVHGATKRKCLRCSGTGVSQALDDGSQAQEIMLTASDEQDVAPAEAEQRPRAPVHVGLNNSKQAQDAANRQAAQRVREAQLGALKMAEAQIAARKQAEAEAKTAVRNGVDGAPVNAPLVGSRSHSRQRSVEEFERLEAEAQRLAREEDEATLGKQLAPSVPGSPAALSAQGGSQPGAPLADLLSKRLEDMTPEEIPLFKQKIMETITNLKRAREKAASRLASAEVSGDEGQEAEVVDAPMILGQKSLQRGQQVVVPCDVVPKADVVACDPVPVPAAQEQEACAPRSLGEAPVKEDRPPRAESPQPPSGLPKPIDKAALLEEAFAAAVRQQANAQEAMRRRVGIKPSVASVPRKSASTPATEEVAGKGVGRGKGLRNGTSGPAPVT